MTTTPPENDPVDPVDPAPAPVERDAAAPTRPTFFERLRRSRAAVITGAAALVLGLVGGGLIGHAIGEGDHSDRSSASEGHGDSGRGHDSRNGDSTSGNSRDSKDSTGSNDSKHSSESDSTKND